MEESSKVVVLLGPPGAGKGTQGALLTSSTNSRHISTGDLFRNAVEAKTPAGMRAESCLRSGQLVPDEVVLHVVEEYLVKASSCDSYFDGFPRTRRQAERFDELLERIGLGLTVVLYISVPDDEALNRLALRGRNDDSVDTARYRLDLYHSVTEPLIDYYEEAGVLVRVDGVGAEDTVFDRIRSLLAERDFYEPTY